MLPVSPIVDITHAIADQAGPRFYMLREDLNSRKAPGNKGHKLRLNLREAQRRGHKTVCSVGGRYSNHLHALAASAREKGLRSIGLVRGDEDIELSPTLKECVEWGMVLHWLSRQEYRTRHTPDFIAGWSRRLQYPYWIPEGGSNALGITGCALWGRALEPHLKSLAIGQVMVASGSGGTLAGLRAGLSPAIRIIGVPVVRDASLPDRIESAIASVERQSHNLNWYLAEGYEGGGFGRVTSKLVEGISAFEQETAIPLDPVYTGKLVYAARQMHRDKSFPQSARVLLIHTGGVQGRRSHRVDAIPAPLSEEL